MDREPPRAAGPAWNNSLFEDNAEFGLGMRLGARRPARGRPAALLDRLAPHVGDELVRADPRQPAGRPRPQIAAQRGSSPQLREALGGLDGDRAAPTPLAPARRWSSNLVRQGVWIIGGDGWAYDIGFGGLDHVLSAGPQRQRPRARHRGVLQHRRPGVEGHAAGAVAKFAAAGKGTGKKDLGAIARAYGNVYVAQISMGANELQTTKALRRSRRVAGPVAGHRLLAPASPTASTCRSR